VSNDSDLIDDRFALVPVRPRKPRVPASLDDRIRVLIVDDEEFHAQTVAESLEKVGYACTVATSAADAFARIDTEDFDVVVAVQPADDHRINIDEVESADGVVDLHADARGIVVRIDRDHMLQRSNLTLLHGDHHSTG